MPKKFEDVIRVSPRRDVLWFSAGAPEASHSFLGYARRGDCVSAFKSASKSLQASVPEAQFCAYLDQEAPDAKGSSGEEIVNFAGGFESWYVEAKLQGRRLQHASVYLIVLKEGNSWKVEKVFSDEPAECKAPD